MSEKYDHHTRYRGQTSSLDHCPDCRRPMTTVLDVGGGPPAPKGGGFRYCHPCGQLYVRAEGDRRRLDSQHARLLAREILRLRALAPPEQREAEEQGETGSTR